MYTSRLLLLFISTFLATAHSAAQISSPNGTLYGNEWIDFDRLTLRIDVAQDGIYQIRPDQMQAAGFDFDPSSNYELISLGEPIPIWITNNGIYFYGNRNRSELDDYLFGEVEHRLNPEYSLYTDTLAYYLRQTEGESPAYQLIDNDLNNLPTAETSIERQVTEVFSEGFGIKEFRRQSGFSVYYSRYQQAEGFGHRTEFDLIRFDGTTLSDFEIGLPQVAANSTARLETRFALGFDQHNQQISIDGQSRDSVLGFGWSVQQRDYTFDVQGESVDFRLEGTATTRDKASVAYVTVDYTAVPDADDGEILTFGLIPAAGDRYLDIANFNASSPLAFDLDNQLVLVPQVSGGRAQFRLPSSSGSRQITLVGESGILSPSKLTVIDWQPAAASQDYDYLILTSRRLADPIDLAAFIGYRQSLAGGGHTVHTAFVEDLYEQYGYGVEGHPIAVRNFVAAERLDNPSLNFLFIIGKGHEYRFLRSTSTAADYRPTHFVPAFGYPASDMLLTSEIGSIRPALATGRLAVTDINDLNVYLAKLQANESARDNPQTVVDRSFLKRFLHLGGGTDAGERQAIRSQLSQMEGVIDTTVFAPRVTTFYKVTSDPTETVSRSEIFDNINEGLAVLSFFGHSSGQVFDFDIDRPENYANGGKLPIILSFGCYSGEMYSREQSIGERFILRPETGAIAFGATQGIGFIGSLGFFGKELYRQMGTESYGMGIGEIFRSAVGQFDNSTSYTLITMLEQYALQGDPAYRIHPQPGPDVLVNPESVSFEPRVISLQADSFAVNFDLYNLGQRLATDSLSLRFGQQLPDGSVRELATRRVAAPVYSTSHRFSFINGDNSSVGVNRLLLQIDPLGELDERPNPAATLNNTTRDGNGTEGIPFFVVSTSAQPIQPPRYAATSGSPLTLKAVTSNPLSEERDWILQLSTTAGFEQVVYEDRLNAGGGLLSWSPDFSWQDSTTYYWRVSPDSAGLETQRPAWLNSSFTYLEGVEDGWGLAHYDQFADGQYDLLSNIGPAGFEFRADSLEVGVFGEVNYIDATRPGLSINDAIGDSEFNLTSFVREGMGVFVMEPFTGQLWSNPPDDRFEAGDYGVPTGAKTMFCFWLRTPEERENMLTFLDEVVPENYVVYMTTLRRTVDDIHYSSEWAMDSTLYGRNIYSYLESQGALEVRELDGNDKFPYVLAYRKGVGVLGEAVGDDEEDQIQIRIQYPQRFVSGSLLSPVFGPSSNWEALDWSVEDIDNPLDASSITLYGGDDPSSLDSLQFYSDVGEVDLSQIDADQNPFLQFKWTVTDPEPSTRSAADLSYLYLRGSGVPDLLFNAGAYSNRSPDSLAAGETYRFGIAIQNAARASSDSVEVTAAWLGNNEILESQTGLFKPLIEDDTIRYDISLETAQFQQAEALRISINPSRSQLESNFANNELEKTFDLARDQIDPLVNVTFDGRSIRDGALVSAEPNILIEVTDENRFLLLDRPELFALQLSYPDGQIELIDPANNENIQFEPATDGENNKARLSFAPELPQDGIYNLLVQGADASGNAAGRLNYEISFEVERAVGISRVVNYPNPFSDRTFFVYELSGTEAVDEYRIQIMTVSGRVVRELSAMDLGPLRVGRNQTDFAWDGTDGFGDQLANGVYIYRVLFPQDSELNSLDRLRETALDTYFENGMGKLVILR
ncbi:MAG: C25 family cysteine peptidase, partial [Bacteroidota bacterium]